MLEEKERPSIHSLQCNIKLVQIHLYAVAYSISFSGWTFVEEHFVVSIQFDRAPFFKFITLSIIFSSHFSQLISKGLHGCYANVYFIVNFSLRFINWILNGQKQKHKTEFYWIQNKKIDSQTLAYQLLKIRHATNKIMLKLNNMIQWKRICCHFFMELRLVVRQCWSVLLLWAIW